MTRSLSDAQAACPALITATTAAVRNFIEYLSFCEVDDDDRLKTDQEIYSAKARFATGMKGYTNVLESQNNNLMNISSAFIVEHYRPELDMLPVAAEIMQDPSVRDICG